MESLHHLSELDGPRVAVFDADGVLWRGDVSEDFTRWMIKQGHFDAALWDSYEADNQQDMGLGCLSILRFYTGHKIDTLAEQVAEFWRSGGERQWIESSLQAIRWLSNAGFAVYIVSGTPRLVLEPLIQYLPIPGKQILGLELATDGNNQATGQPCGTPTHGPGKATAIREATTAPIYLAAGNSHIDIEMITLSSDLHWAIEPDKQLRSVATRENWTIIDNP